MRKYIIKRLLQSVIILFGVTLIIFFLLHLAPGDPFIQNLNPNVTPEVREKMLRSIGYYDPIYIQYFKWLSQILRGNLGFSIQFGKPVLDVIRDYLPNTILLGSTSLLLSLCIAIPAGIYSSRKRGSLFDYLVTFFCFLGISIPAFFFGLLMIKWFAFDLKIFPTSGMISIGKDYTGWAHFFDVMKHMFLPTLVLSLVNTASFMRYTRSSMIEVIGEDYIRTARAKGLLENKVIYKHAFRNALISIITVITLTIPEIFSGAVLTETIFVWPGIGRVNYDAIGRRDYPMVMGILLLLASIILFSNLLADILYAVVDPRIRYDEEV